MLPLGFAVLGTVALAYAWKVQNYDLASATDIRASLQRSQLVVNLWEAKRDQWVIAMDQELTKTQPDRLFLARATAEASKATIMWQGYMKVRVEKNGAERERIFTARNQLLSGIDVLLAKVDTKALQEVFSANVSTFNSSQSLEALDQRYFAIIDETDEAARIANKKMSTFYVAGTALMLLSTIVASLQLVWALGSLQESMKRPPATKQGDGAKRAPKTQA